MVKTSQFEVDIESDFLKISNTQNIIASCIFFLYTVCDLKKNNNYFLAYLFLKKKHNNNKITHVHSMPKVGVNSGANLSLTFGF